MPVSKLLICHKELHSYYAHYFYLPLYVFAGQALLACGLRRSGIDGAKHAAAVIKLLLPRLRQAWPNARVNVRGDFGFSRSDLFVGANGTTWAM